MTYQNDSPPADYEPTPVIGPGICEAIAERILTHTLVSDIDPLTIFPQETEEDLEKLEARVEGWYNLISLLGELKQQIAEMRSQPFTGTNRLGNYYIRVEQYLLLLTSPNCTPELKARYWADVVAAQNSQQEVVPTVTITLNQSEYGENLFEATVGEVAKEPVYFFTGQAEQCLKRCTQFYRVRRWNCGSWKVIFVKGDPLQFESPETMPMAIATRLDEQADDLYIERANGLSV